LVFPRPTINGLTWWALYRQIWTRACNTQLSKQLTHLVLIELQHELQDLGQLLDQRLLGLQMLCRIELSAHQLAQQLGHNLVQLHGVLVAALQLVDQREHRCPGFSKNLILLKIEKVFLLRIIFCE